MYFPNRFDNSYRLGSDASLACIGEHLITGKGLRFVACPPIEIKERFRFQLDTNGHNSDEAFPFDLSPPGSAAKPT
uniref:Uncharacterized protein n=1 Tax=Steinernema glaseri TaxID=37863 RepID=A0A1I7Z9U5_9BILA